MGRGGEGEGATEQFIVSIESLQTVLRLPGFGKNVERDIVRCLENRNLHECTELRHQVVQPCHVKPLKVILSVVT